MSIHDFIKENSKSTKVIAPIAVGIRGEKLFQCICQCDCVGAPGNCSPGG